MTLSSFALRRIATIVAVAILTLMLLAGGTGILLAFYYEPTAGGAYQSLRTLTTQQSYGWLIRTLHHLAGNLVIALGLIQMVVMFFGARPRTSWRLAWMSGIVLILASMGLSWTAMILDWSQTGFWRFKVELGTIESIPLIGATLRDILTGGNGISSLTVAHMFTLHSYVLSAGAVLLAIAHLGALLWQEWEMQRHPLELADTSAETATDQTRDRAQMREA